MISREPDLTRPARPSATATSGIVFLALNMRLSSPFQAGMRRRSARQGVGARHRPRPNRPQVSLLTYPWRLRASERATRRSPRPFRVSKSESQGARNGVRGSTVSAGLLGIEHALVERVEYDQEAQLVVVHVRPSRSRPDRCRRCEKRSPRYDQGEGRRRVADAGRWRSSGRCWKRTHRALPAASMA